MSQDSSMVVLVRSASDSYASLKAICAEMEVMSSGEEQCSFSSSSRYHFMASGETIEHEEFIAMPRQVLSLYREVHNASYMGILPEINRAWVTIDNRLYLWNYEQPDQFTEYEGLDDAIFHQNNPIKAPLF